MSSLTLIYIILCSVALCWVVLNGALRMLNSDKLREGYIAQVTALLLCGEEPQQKVCASTPRRRMALAEAIYTVMSHTYYNDISLLRSVVEQTRLEPFLWRRIALSSGARRARLLMLTSTLPLHTISIIKLQRYARSSDNDVRISALTSLLAANPSTAIHTIAALEFELSPFDLARIIALLRRGLLPIAYEPLLASEKRNLRLLGLAIVRSFGLESAERRLHHIISSESDMRIITQTIYTLASLGRPLGHTRIRERLAAMPAIKRKELCRHLTVEGYSLGAVRSLFNEYETLYAEGLINSYKRRLGRSIATS